MMRLSPKSVTHKVPYEKGDIVYLAKDITASEDSPGGLLGRAGDVVVVTSAWDAVKDRETYCVNVCHEHLLDIKVGFAVALSEICSDKRNCEKSLDDVRESLYNM